MQKTCKYTYVNSRQEVSVLKRKGVSADSYLINETIPDNCIVFGRSPDITIKPASEDKIKDMTSHIWEW